MRTEATAFSPDPPRGKARRRSPAVGWGDRDAWIVPMSDAEMKEYRWPDVEIAGGRKLISHGGRVSQYEITLHFTGLACRRRHCIALRSASQYDLRWEVRRVTGPICRGCEPIVRNGRFTRTWSAR